MVATISVVPEIAKEAKDFKGPFSVYTENHELITGSKNLSWSDAIQLLINAFLYSPKDKKQTFYMKDSSNIEIFQLP